MVEAHTLLNSKEGTSTQRVDSEAELLNLNPTVVLTQLHAFGTEGL